MTLFKSIFIISIFSFLSLDSHSQSRNNRNRKCPEDSYSIELSKLVFSSSYQIIVDLTDSLTITDTPKNSRSNSFIVTPLIIYCDLNYPGKRKHFSYASLKSPTQFESDEFTWKHRVFCRKSESVEELRITARSFPNNNRLHRIKLRFMKDNSTTITIKYAGRRYTYHGRVHTLSEKDYDDLLF